MNITIKVSVPYRGIHFLIYMQMDSAPVKWVEVSVPYRGIHFLIQRWI